MKEKNKLVVLIALMVVAAIVWSYAWNKQATAADDPMNLTNLKVLAVENIGIRWDELSNAQKTEYKSSGRNPFSMVKPPPQKQPVKTTEVRETGTAPLPKPLPPEPPPPPPKLPANLKYFGYGTVPSGSPRRAFFKDTEDDQVLIVPEGETLLGRYRIMKVGNSDIEFQEISSGRRGTAPLEELGSAPNA